MKGKKSVKVYVYFELVKTYRNPKNKDKVCQVFVKHLGNDPALIREKLLEYRSEAQGQYSVERLVKVLERDLTKE